MGEDGNEPPSASAGTSPVLSSASAPVLLATAPVFSDTDPVADGPKSDPAPGSASRTRKKVTFDLDLQVHTIPNRIPIYERRPAVSTAYARPQQRPPSFVRNTFIK